MQTIIVGNELRGGKKFHTKWLRLERQRWYYCWSATHNGPKGAPSSQSSNVITSIETYNWI